MRRSVCLPAKGCISLRLRTSTYLKIDLVAPDPSQLQSAAFKSTIASLEGTIATLRSNGDDLNVIRFKYVFQPHQRVISSKTTEIASLHADITAQSSSLTVASLNLKVSFFSL